MKKLKITLSLAFFLLAISFSNAQVEKGSLLLGAKSNFGAFFGNSTNEYTVDGTTTSKDGPKTTNFNFTPSVGYFFIDGFAGGLFFSANIANSKEDQELETGGSETLKDNSSTIQVGPFIRYYIDMDKVKPFVEAHVGFGSQNYKYDYLDYDYSDPLNPVIVIKQEDMKNSLFGWGVGVGAAFFITNSVAVDVMLGYDSFSIKNEDDDKNITKNKGGSFGLDVGFSIVIPTSK